tara:strand:- start:22 stop:168 length:147 start_codon:yes stop_codon:yes gene_type:complete
MDSDLLIPLFWTIAFASLITIGLRKITKRAPKEKKWVRPENKVDQDQK